MVEKADFDEQLRTLMNASLAAKECTKRFGLRVEELEAGILIYTEDLLGDLPEGTMIEEIVAPIYREDLAADALLMLDLLVLEQERRLWSKIMLRVHIDEAGEVVVKGQEIDETEILLSDLSSSRRRKACKEQLEAKTRAIANAAKAAITHLMRGNAAGAARE
jgi:hypothetical protein